MITIKLHVDFTMKPHEGTVRAIELLLDAVKSATPSEPALGGALRDESGAQVGSYLVEFDR